VSDRWLDKYAEFARRWDEFQAAWKWAQTQPYTPDRRPGLHTFFDLMQVHVVGQHYARARAAVARRPAGFQNSVRKAGYATSPTDTVTDLTSTARLIMGDFAETSPMHSADATADVVIADVPYFIRNGDDLNTTDYYLALNGMAPRLREDWDQFNSIEDYEHHAERWLTEIMRCLKEDGSAFIFGIFSNLPLIARFCQMHGHHIVGEIVWVLRNGRPAVARTRLQPSHQNILWIVRHPKAYRFNYHDYKRADHPQDYFNTRGKQMRDVWDIPAAPQENRYGHPSPKPLAVYQRLLEVAGKPGGLLIDAFSGSGSGTGAIAALRWGMSSISIERNPEYCDMIRRRVADELKRRTSS
jgi:site-specific DNA-methyltransferase (adenine-specific)